MYDTKQPATAGKVISEKELRAFNRCSEFYSFGGKYEPSDSLSILQGTVERMVIASIEEQIDAPSLSFSKYMLQTIKFLKLKDKYIESDLETLYRQSSITIHNFWKSFNTNKLIPITGPFPVSIRVLRTPIEIRVNSIFRRKQNKEIVAIMFSPYETEHGMKNDPIPYLTLQALSNFGTEHFARSSLTVISFGIRPNGNILISTITDNDYSKNHWDKINLTVRAMEAGYHFPILPCNYNCPYKNICYPR